MLLTDMQPLVEMPDDINADYGAEIVEPVANEYGRFRVLHVARTAPKGWQGQRIVVLVLDQNYRPIPLMPVAFAWDTYKERYSLDGFKWTPPGAGPEHKRVAFIEPTQGSGQIDVIQGSGIEKGGKGGTRVWVHHPLLPSAYVDGAGMLADHSGMFIVFVAELVGVLPLEKRLEIIELRLNNMQKLLTEFMQGQGR